MNNIERRFLQPDKIDFRAVEDENGKRFLEGHAALFNVRSKLILEGGRTFFETIERGAFDEILRNENLDVKFVFNHDRNKMLARTVSKTLSLSLDNDGLFFRAELPKTVLADEVYELVKRGDLFSNSFAFSVTPNDIEWGKNEEGIRTRKIKRIAGLYDVSVVTDAAYEGTDVAARSLDEIEKAEQIYNTEPYRRRLQLLKLKIN